MLTILALAEDTHTAKPTRGPKPWILETTKMTEWEKLCQASGGAKMRRNSKTGNLEYYTRSFSEKVGIWYPEKNYGEVYNTAYAENSAH